MLFAVITTVFLKNIERSVQYQTRTIFFLYGMYIYLLVRTDKEAGKLGLSKRTQTVGTIFSE